MDIRITKTKTPKSLPPESELGFGKYFTDHFFLMDFVPERGWQDARIEPYGPLAIDPAASVLHYGQAMFEGLKAFRGVDGKIRLFRAQANANRMVTGAPRLCMESPSEAQMLEAFCALVKMESHWVPSGPGTALYLRPTLIATEAFLGVRPATRFTFFLIASPVSNYFAGKGLGGLRIWVETHDVRAARGGLGAVKAGANYVASLHAAQEAKKKGFDQVLWLDGRDHEFVEEVGTMNLMVMLGETLVTPPLSDSILAGVTRDSLLTLAREHGIRIEERPLSMKELRSAQHAGTLKEVFGTGTAAVVSPVRELAFAGETMLIGKGEVGPVATMLHKELMDLQRGVKADSHGWLTVVV